MLVCRQLRCIHSVRFTFVMDLQVHYAQGRPKGDAPGFRLSMIAQPTPHSAGMITFASNFAVSANAARHPISVANCSQAARRPVVSRWAEGTPCRRWHLAGLKTAPCCADSAWQAQPPGDQHLLLCRI